MSGPRTSNVGQMNGNRRSNISRLNIHDTRSHHDHRQQSFNYDNRQASSHHENRHPPIAQPINSQHEDLIKYVSDSWSKIEMDRDSTNVMYHQEHENHHLKDFRPFDLEAYWGRRLHQNHQQSHTNHHHQHQSHHQSHYQQHHS